QLRFGSDLMAIRANKYSDPALGAAFENIASMFAPPSAADSANYAQAGLDNQKKTQLAEFFRIAQDPNVDRRVFDQLGVVTGNGTIANGYYGVDEGEKTLRRGQDVVSATSR